MGFVVIGLQIPVLRLAGFTPAWRSYRLVLAGVIAVVMLASNPGWTTSVVQPDVYDSATLTYDAPIDLASSRGPVDAITNGVAIGAGEQKDIESDG